MSHKRQDVINVPLNMNAPAIARAENYQKDTCTPWHTHDVGQLIHAISGVMTVETDDGIWVVPPGRAVWVPEMKAHRIHMKGAVALRSLYLLPSLSPFTHDRCCVVEVSGLLKEGILRVITFEQPYAENSREARLVRMLLDEVRVAMTEPLHLPSLKDPRAKKIAEAFKESVNSRMSSAAWAEFSGMSSRTLERLFRAETGMTFGTWQRQVRLLKALESMAAGQSVTSAALEVGFETPSAFISMFRRAMGITPAKYFRCSKEGRDTLV